MRRKTIPEPALVCSACGCARDARPGWRAYLSDEAGGSVVVAFCPECAEGEHGTNSEAPETR
jgi:hypothetical protein